MTSFLRDFSYCDVFFEVSSFAVEPTENVSLFHGIAIIVLSRAKYNICCVCLAFLFLSYTCLVHLKSNFESSILSIPMD